MPEPFNEALHVRMEIKRLIRLAQEDYPDFDFLGDVDEVDVAIEALIHPEKFQLAIAPRLREV